MEDKSKQDELITFFEQNNYDKAVIDRAKSDFEAGLSAKQVSIYKVRRLKKSERDLISKAMRLDMPQDLVSNMVNHKYKEPQYAAVIGEFEGGTDISVIKDVMKEFRFGHDINETFIQVKERLANSMEKPSESESNEPAKESAVSEKTEPDNKPEAVVSGISGQDFMDTMKMMMDTFSNTMQMQFDRMDKRDEELRKASLDKDAEKLLNDRISDLESQLADSRKDLSAASGVVSEKEQQLKSMQSDMDICAKELSKKDAEIKKLREEMEQMRSGNISGGYSQAAAGLAAGGMSAASSAGAVSAGQTAAGRSGQQVSYQQTAAAGISEGNPGYTPNYTMNLTTQNGNQIPLQVERTERKSPFGLSSLMSKFLPKGPAKTLLTRMIEGRYSGEQLSEIVYAYNRKLDEAEVQELLDANLPPEEMHGIIEVVAAAKGGEE